MRTPKSLMLTLLYVLLVVPLAAQESEESELKSLQKAEMQRYQRRLQESAHLSAASTNIDVKYYALDLRINTESRSLSGKVSVSGVSLADNVNQIILDLKTMVVDSVVMNGQPLGFLKRSASLEIALPSPLNTGQTFSLDIYYYGSPQSSGFGSFAYTIRSDSSAWVWTLSEPYGARDWWPCKDHPTDKADSLDVRVTVSSDLKVASQGILISETTNLGGTITFHWRHRYPIATYLVSLAIARYTEIVQWFRYSPTDSMVIRNYVIPASVPTAQVQLPHILPQLQIFSDMFGLYPFYTEKYGHAQFGWGGGMEHQTITSLGGYSENLLAHELAHQWFGDMITMSRWPDIWLNEGFATYCVALYRERRYGVSDYWNYMNSRFAQARDAIGSLYVSDTTNVSQLFNGNLVYAKGAVVLHMLRHVIGDSSFFRFMKEYALDPQLRFSTASTADVQRVSEAVSGMSLSFFFDQWVYGSGYPQYNVDWRSGTGTSGRGVQVRVVQPPRSQSPSSFIMPIDMRFRSASADTTITVWVRNADTTFTFDLPFPATAFEFDPNNWILKSATITPSDKGSGLPVNFSLSQNFPNPFNSSTTFAYDIPQTSHVKIEIFDLLGRHKETIVDEVLPARSHQIPWNPSLPSGVYFVRMTASSLSSPVRTYIRTVKTLLIK